MSFHPTKSDLHTNDLDQYNIEECKLIIYRMRDRYNILKY